MASGNRAFRNRSQLRLFCLLLVLVTGIAAARHFAGWLNAPTVLANNTAQTLPFSQPWTNTGLITANDNWTSVPGIVGFLGDYVPGNANNPTESPTDVDPQTILVDMVTVDVIANLTNSTSTAGGVGEFHGTSQIAPANADATIGLQGSGTADGPNIVLYLNTTGQTGINVAYNLRDIDCAADNSVQQVALQYRVGPSGNFTNVPAAYVADATTGPSLCTLVTPINVALPAAADNQANVQIRIISSNASGSDEWVGVDDISVTSGVAADIPPTVNSTVPADNAVNIAVNANVSVTFSEPVTATASSFQISCSLSSTHTFNLSGGLTTYTLDPATNFTQGDACTVTVVAAQVVDQDGTPDQMATDYVFDFTVVNTAPVAIHTIQGSGASSPLVGQSVTTTGIVTLLRTSSNAGGAGATASGFFLQEPDASTDADPNTSEGIFVFTSTVPTYTAPATPVAVGDELTVTGTVVEFGTGGTLTEIGTVTNLTIVDTGNTLPTAVTITAADLPANGTGQPQLEKYEAMRMSAASLTTTAPNDNFFDVATVLPGVPRQQVFREPGIPASDPVPPDPTSGLQDCCIPIWDENPERLLLDTNGRALSPLVGYTSTVVFSNVAGPLDFAFGQYRLIPDASLAATANMNAVPVPAPLANEFTIVGYNIENFNNDTTQREKAALTVRTVLHYPDIIGAIEIFDLADLQALRDEINNDAVGAGDPNPMYEAYLVEQDGTSEDSDQDVGYLVKTSRVSVTSVTQRLQAETFVEPGTGTVAILHDRPPLVLDATVDPLGANVRVLVVVNHLRSFIDVELVGGDGPRVREKRKKQAESLGVLLHELQTNNPTTSVISVGDYNAFQFSSGYDDSVSVLKGSPTADNQIVVDQSPDVVNPNFINLIENVPADQRYSFVFEHTAQVLDQVLVNRVAQARNTRIAIARVNADFPSDPAATYEGNAARAERNSDHDPAVAYFSLASARSGDLLVSEYRLRGTLGASDEFVEIYNNTDAAIVVSSGDGSAGFSLVASDGIARFTIPNSTSIPARGHYLAQGPTYSIGGYPAGNGTTATGDQPYAVEIQDLAAGGGGCTGVNVSGRGIALFNTAMAVNFTLANRLDAVGSVCEPDPLYREGAGVPVLSNAVSNTENSFFRNQANSTGHPKDTDDNLADFLHADTNAASAGAGQRLGAPGPENLTSPIHNSTGTMLLPVFDPSVSAATSPNFVYDPTSVPNGASGTITIRRNLINNTGTSISQVRFRVVDITSFPPPGGGVADLRVLATSPNLALETPPAQPNGGAFNSSLGVTAVTSASPLANGGNTPVDFVFGVATEGCFRFVVIAEALPGGASTVFGFSGTAGSGMCGPTAAPADISGSVITPDGQPLAGVTMRLAGARAATTITDAAGNYHFDNVDTEQFYTVTPARVNYHFNPGNLSFSLLANKTDAVFTAIPDAVIVGNAIDTSEYFVRQHYLDFLGREPDQGGFNFWSNEIASCGSDEGCVERKRINVSAAYFLSIEFQNTGGLVDGLYRASFGRRPLYAEFMPDAQSVAQGVIVGEGDWESKLASNKRAFVQSFVNRTAFRVAYDGLSSSDFVDALISHTGVSFADRDALVSELSTGTLTRAEVLLRIAENEGFVQSKRNAAFVMMEYFGYLRRDPDESGYAFWLNKLNQFDGNFERAEMVKAFIDSIEYRARFQR